MIFLAIAWRWIARAAGGAWRALETSKPLRWIAAGAVALFVAVFTFKRAVEKAKREGRREGREEILDRIERDTKNAVQKIEEAERQITREVGPPDVFEDAGDGKGLTTDDYNGRELERVRRKSEGDPRNRGNPRTLPRDPV